MKDTVYDVVVIGGGPAGMMSAGRSAELGAKVILLEKNDSLGKKLLITGGGRCNVTNAEFDNRKLLERFKDDGKFLFSAFSQWNVKDTLDFFHKRNMETKVENEQRVFPVSDKAESVFNVMVEYVKTNGVEIVSNSPVEDLVLSDGKIVGVKLKNGGMIKANSVIVATGGTSHPETGSTGDAYKWLKKVGHKIIEPTPSLVPLATKDAWVKKLSGVTLKNIRLTVFSNGIKQSIKAGKQKGLSIQPQKILFTHFGVSGPTVLNMSKDIGELLKYGEVVLSLDLLPKFDHGQLNAELQEIFVENDKKKFKNALSDLIPSSMAPVIVELSKIDPEVQCNSITREERMNLITLLKNTPIHIHKLLGAEKAIITSGGVSLEEVDFKTMRSKLFSNLYFVGDVLNIDRPSGGYSLQLCWTTGFVAGTNATKNHRSKPVA
jgi:predicted Rossmann fold flavoprotein